MLFNNILVVLDPNQEKQYALERAVRLVKEQNHAEKVKITAFMAVYDVAYEMSELLSTVEGDKMRDSIITQKHKDLQPILSHYQRDDIEFNTIVVWESNEADAITQAVKAEHFDLVVKYTNAKDEGLSALIFTPQDWQLLRKCPAPIMMVRNHNWDHQRRILVAVNVAENDSDHSTFNEELVQMGVNLAKDLGRGNVHLVSAYPPAAINMAIDMPEFKNEVYTESERESYLSHMEKLRQQFGIDSAHTHVEEGFPEDVIPQVAKDLQAEIVVLGTVGRRGLAAAFLGNTAEHVISRLNCNLLAIKPSDVAK